jgi:molybdopterin-guanine dinucleotide biosynthesis protein A
MKPMNCIVAAGGSVSPEDPLYAYTRGKPKALLEIAGRTMLEHVLWALHGARQIGDIVVAGLEKEDVVGLDLPHVARFLADRGGLISNLKMAIEWMQTHRPETKIVLLCGADIPLLTNEIVDAFVDSCRPFDCMAYHSVVTRDTMESRFPNSGRTFVKLKGIEIAGGDLSLAQTRITQTDPALWEALVHGRKRAWKLARIVGPKTLLKLLFRQLSLSEVEALAGKAVDAPVRIMKSPFPELAMDVDNPRHVELVRNILRPRVGA